MAEEKRWYTGMFSTEDWWSFWIGLFFVLVGLIAAATGVDISGWVIGFEKWVNISNALQPDHAGIDAKQCFADAGMTTQPFPVRQNTDQQQK